jgi:hypothetical protein
MLILGEGAEIVGDKCLGVREAIQKAPKFSRENKVRKRAF